MIFPPLKKTTTSFLTLKLNLFIKALSPCDYANSGKDMFFYHANMWAYVYMLQHLVNSFVFMLDWLIIKCQVKMNLTILLYSCQFCFFLALFLYLHSPVDFFSAANGQTTHLSSMCQHTCPLKLILIHLVLQWVFLAAVWSMQERIIINCSV